MPREQFHPHFIAIASALSGTVQSNLRKTTHHLSVYPFELCVRPRNTVARQFIWLATDCGRRRLSSAVGPCVIYGPNMRACLFGLLFFFARQCFGTRTRWEFSIFHLSHHRSLWVTRKLGRTELPCLGNAQNGIDSSGIFKLSYKAYSNVCDISIKNAVVYK